MCGRGKGGDRNQDGESREKHRPPSRRIRNMAIHHKPLSLSYQTPLYYLEPCHESRRIMIKKRGLSEQPPLSRPAHPRLSFHNATVQPPPHFPAPLLNSSPSRTLQDTSIPPTPP